MNMNKISVVYMVLIAFVFSGCSKYGFVSLNYPLAPAVYLPDNIRTIAIVNRSLTKNEDKKNKIVESILTGEIGGSDRLASDECLKGVFDRINGLRGINIIIPQKTRLYGTGTRETPELLDWKLVQAICDSANANALLVLETFDSNTNLLASSVKNQVVRAINGSAPTLAPPNQIRMNVLSFWRLYDPSTKKIIDQFQSSSNLNFNIAGNEFGMAPPEALPNTAYAAGQEYIQRFLPGYYTVKRDMYKRGKGSAKQEFLAAFRHAEVANWQGAIDAWSEIVKHTGRKNAGRACLNIAVSYEVLGNTDLALQWVKKSYEDYNNKLGREYANILLRRKNLEF
jgi:hypothetical protein